MLLNHKKNQILKHKYPLYKSKICYDHFTEIVIKNYHLKQLSFSSHYQKNIHHNNNSMKRGLTHLKRYASKNLALHQKLLYYFLLIRKNAKEKKHYKTISSFLTGKLFLSTLDIYILSYFIQKFI